MLIGCTHYGIVVDNHNRCKRISQSCNRRQCKTRKETSTVIQDGARTQTSRKDPDPKTIRSNSEDPKRIEELSCQDPERIIKELSRRETQVFDLLFPLSFTVKLSLTSTALSSRARQERKIVTKQEVSHSTSDTVFSPAHRLVA